MRFKVLILIPAIGFAFVAILAGGIARSDSAFAILIAFVLVSSCLQIGYLCSILTRYGMAMARPGSRHKPPLHAESAR